MPAKAKYLSTTGQRVWKISAGVLGGYLLTSALQLAIAAWLVDKGPVLITFAYLSFFLWVGFMVAAFLARDGRRVWAAYLLAIGACAAVVALAP